MFFRSSKYTVIAPAVITPRRGDETVQRNKWSVEMGSSYGERERRPNENMTYFLKSVACVWVLRIKEYKWTVWTKIPEFEDIAHSTLQEGEEKLCLLLYNII